MCSLRSYTLIYQLWTSLTQHTYNYTNGGGCLHPVIQRKHSTNVLQGLKPLNGTGKEKVQTAHQTVLTILLHECVTVHQNYPRHFLFLSFSSTSSPCLYSSSRTLRSKGKVLPQYCRVQQAVFLKRPEWLGT